jgi:putative oxidoreductase
MQFLANLHQLGDVGLLALRIGVGVIFLVHGIQKLAMWKMQPSAQMPAGMLSVMKSLSIVETLGGLAVLIGFLTQFVAVGLGIIMIGAIQLKVSQMHKKFSGEGGWEFDLILLAAAIALLFSGAGSLGLDRVLFGI